MARPKKVIKAKEPVRIRFKELANGNKSIYLDIYKDGSRSYEFLKLYLIPETSAVAKEQNAATLLTVEALKAQRVIDVQNSSSGVKRNNSIAKNVTLFAFLESYRQDREDKYLVKHKNETDAIPERSNAIKKLVKHLSLYHPKDIALSRVDKEFCQGFLKYLRTAKDLRYVEEKDKKNKVRSKNENDKAALTRKTDPKLSGTSQREYFCTLNSALKIAVRKDFIPFNPIDKILREDWPQSERNKREYLTVEEVKKLQETPCYDENTKKAFLFACFCGLRLSDVRRLTWANIVQGGTPDNPTMAISTTMKKTGQPITIPLSKKAMEFLPGRIPNKEHIFSLKSTNQVEEHIAWWVRDAGITKHVTMHVSRHTNATMLLTLGAPIETISKLLGHTHIATTEIYAEVVNEKKEEAINLLDQAF